MTEYPDDYPETMRAWDEEKVREWEQALASARSRSQCRQAIHEIAMQCRYLNADRMHCQHEGTCTIHLLAVTARMQFLNEH